jgi:hypothetical protein
MQIQLLTAVTAVNGVPSGSSAGKGLRGLPDNLGGLNIDEAALAVKSTAGSGAMSVTLKLWVWHDVLAEWMPLGSSTVDADRGKVNQATAIGEVATDKLQHTELVRGLRHFDRIYCEVTAIVGTGTAVSAWLLSRDAAKAR